MNILSNEITLVDNAQLEMLQNEITAPVLTNCVMDVLMELCKINGLIIKKTLENNNVLFYNAVEKILFVDECVDIGSIERFIKKYFID